MTGDAAADFMRGLIISDTTPTVQLESSGLQWRNDFFVLDKWNATRNLTLNIGIRYELPTVPVSPSGIANALSPDGKTLLPTRQTPNYGFTLPNHKQWAPRVGFRLPDRREMGGPRRGRHLLQPGDHQRDHHTFTQSCRSAVISVTTRRGRTR